MKRITALASLVTFSSLFLGVGVEPVSARISCQETVDPVAREIWTRGTTVRVKIYEEFSEPDYLRNSRRLGAVHFELDVRDINRHSDRETFVAKDIFKSEVLMKSYASQIFANCGGTGYVLIEPSWTRYGGTFGMIDSGTLAYEICSIEGRIDLEEIPNRISEILGVGHGSCAYFIPDF